MKREGRILLFCVRFWFLGIELNTDHGHNFAAGLQHSARAAGISESLVGQVQQLKTLNNTLCHCCTMLHHPAMQS